VTDSLAASLARHAERLTGLAEHLAGRGDLRLAASLHAHAALTATHATVALTLEQDACDLRAALRQSQRTAEALKTELADEGTAHAAMVTRHRYAKIVAAMLPPVERGA